MIPSDLAADIDELVGKRGRSRFLVDIAAREVRRLRLLRALDRAAGSWKPENYPEFRRGAGRWIRDFRKLSETRFRRLEDR